MNHVTIGDSLFQPIWEKRIPYVTFFSRYFCWGTRVDLYYFISVLYQSPHLKNHFFLKNSSYWKKTSLNISQTNVFNFWIHFGYVNSNMILFMQIIPVLPHYQKIGNKIIWAVFKRWIYIICQCFLIVGKKILVSKLKIYQTKMYFCRIKFVDILIQGSNFRWKLVCFTNMSNLNFLLYWINLETKKFPRFLC